MRVRRDDKALTLEYEQPLSYINNTGNGLEDISINEIVEYIELVYPLFQFRSLRFLFRKNMVLNLQQIKMEFLLKKFFDLLNL